MCSLNMGNSFSIFQPPYKLIENCNNIQKNYFEFLCVCSFPMIHVPNLKYKTTLCHNWVEGTLCEKGPNCYFAHGEQQLRKIEENQQAIASRNMYYQNFQQSHNYKTVYCKFYAKGQCKLGLSCTFAHQRKQKRKAHKPTLYQQAPIMPCIPFSTPYIYPLYQNFDPSQYYTWTYDSVANLQNHAENTNPKLNEEEMNEVESKSEEKKRSRIEERSTNEKENEDVENEEDLPKPPTENKCFNFQ